MGNPLRRIVVIERGDGCRGGVVQPNHLVEDTPYAQARYEIRRFIGEKLVAYYSLPEPLPERLAELIKQLEQQAAERGRHSP